MIAKASVRKKATDGVEHGQKTHARDGGECEDTSAHARPPAPPHPSRKKRQGRPGPRKDTQRAAEARPSTPTGPKGHAMKEQTVPRAACQRCQAEETHSGTKPSCHWGDGGGRVPGGPTRLTLGLARSNSRAPRESDTPITEHGFAGSRRRRGILAPCGAIVLSSWTFNFAMQAMAHIVNSAAKTLYIVRWPRWGRPWSCRGPNVVLARGPVGAQQSQDSQTWYS